MSQILGATPLSDLIAQVKAVPSDAYEAFLRAFARSRVGVIAIGAPPGTVGDHRTTADHPVGLGLTGHADGGPMILTFADPKVFAERFGQPFNADMNGGDVIETCLADPACEGILVNSAAAQVSIVIARGTAEALRGSL